MLPGAERPIEATLPDGNRVDLFDLTDHLAAVYRRIYVVDLEGVERNLPQLDYLSELTRDTDVWIDAGVKSADSVIDVLVTGAHRAVVSTGRLHGPAELHRALRLTPEIALEVEISPTGMLQGRNEWGEDILGLAASARGLGVSELIVSPRERPVDWGLVRALANGGSVWVDGGFLPAEAPELARSGAAGGLFHIAAEIIDFAEHPRTG